MTVDKYKDEPTVEIDSDIYFAWLEARGKAMAAEAEQRRLEAKLRGQLGTAHAGTIQGVKVLTNRPSSTYRVKDLMAEFPDLANFYMVAGPEVFDLSSFVKGHPQEAERFRSTQFRPVEVKA